ncbi:MAG: hypothetical protein Q4D13_06770 [Erysipelotrichaceae bacterium]|nr:hypothetical protein [Erysipelotrichaceae bacterium]
MKLKKKDVNDIRKKVNGQIALEMRKKSPRASVTRDRKKEASRSACRGKASFYCATAFLTI